ncbi:hypothetical protein [Bradyrhizobium sp. 33ap4]|uniref:hypothetical protein n=1 Tax=Bradyrhizobium sp. 33ap4 TaxID=3061630 RepID=UPI0029311082|nr:hypothetical protein [Bradyrhizobium sp. 33ap4]
MSDPQPYSPSYNFSSFQANSPTSPLPAPKVDNEYDNIASAILQLVNAIKDVRRSDGALKNGIVNYDSLALGLQLTFDPTNGDLVAAAVAGAEASAAAAAASETAAAGSAAASATSAAAAAASASSVNLSLFLTKAGNLAGIGSPDTALANISAMKIDGSNATYRLAKQTAGMGGVTDWNVVGDSGWYSAAGAANAPVYAGQIGWLVQVLAASTHYVTQIAYPYSAGTATSVIVPFRRHGYDTGGGIAWTAWESQATLPVGSTIMMTGSTVPPGFLAENGALVSRTTYPALWTWAQASGAIVSEATWAAGNNGAFSTGDLATTFRLPDSRGEFIRGWDNARGIDAGRFVGAWQGDLLKDHTHPYDGYDGGSLNAGGGIGGAHSDNTTGGVNGGLGGTETRPRNVAKQFCIKY